MSQALLPQNYKGYFVSESALTTAIPNGNKGWWAIIQASSKIYVWNVQSGSWQTSSSGGGGIDSVTGNIVNNTDPANPVVTQAQPDWNAVSGLGEILNKPSTNLSFSFGDASPVNVIIAQVGQLIESVKILILTPFDGVGASLEVGDVGQSDRLLLQNQVNPSVAATYESNPNYTYGSITQIELTINPGTGATQGSGLLVITYKS